jgi:phenylacetate-coenzyme A ligase PaaK-like adenylate-forming protein
MYPNIEQIIQNKSWISSISDQNFDNFALALFRFQYERTEIYRDYVRAIGVDIAAVKTLRQIPFLPISFFKTHKVLCQHLEAAVVFESSGTTGSIPSRHFVYRPDIYEASFLHHFNHFYGEPDDYIFLCLLPSYIERKNASLVYMAKHLIAQSNHPDSGFYLDEWEKLAVVLKQAQDKKKKVMLLGVTFALLDFAEAYPMDLSGVIIMETGGMKGRREEWTRQQVHDFLKEKWQLTAVHSEYGMTELLSQAYSQKNGRFHTANLMKAFVRDENDPFSNFESGNGCLNLIDLANVYSCAFIATEDLAHLRADGSFEVLGRMDFSALRGCSLMAI